MIERDEALKNSPANPLHPYASLDMAGRNGLTKRELFAAMAMQGAMSNSEISRQLMAGNAGIEFQRSLVASAATSMADALIKALNDESDQG